MAEEVQISGGPETAKIRNVLAPLGLGLITLGIYNIVWWYKVNRELADYGRKNGIDLGDSPIKSVLAVTIGWIIIVPAVLSIIGTWKRTKAAQQHAGLTEAEQGSGALYGILMFFVSIAAYCYLQSELNKIWKRQAGGAPAATPAFVAPGTVTPDPAVSVSKDSGIPGA